MKNFAKAFVAPTLAQEAQASDVQKKRENEVVIYARITDFDGLKKASSKLIQEQWQVKAPYGNIRVRQETQEGLEGKYTMAIKTKDNKLGGQETEMEIDKTVFDSFMSISDKGMVKDRYCFPVSKVSMRDSSGKHNVALPDLLFEVDVYKKEDGSYHEWVKIDLEIDSILQAVQNINKSITTADLSINIAELPFKPTDMIEGSTKDATEQAKITQLYDDVFLTLRSNKPQTTEEVPTPVVSEEAPKEEPVQSEPVVTDAITGVDDQPKQDTAENPSLDEPPQVTTTEKDSEQDNPDDKKVQDVDVPVVPAEQESEKTSTELEDKTQERKQEGVEQIATQSTPEVKQEPVAPSEVVQEQPTEPVGEVIEAGGDDKSPEAELTADEVRKMIREELSVFTDSLNTKAPAP